MGDEESQAFRRNTAVEVMKTLSPRAMCPKDIRVFAQWSVLAADCVMVALGVQPEELYAAAGYNEMPRRK